MKRRDTDCIVGLLLTFLLHTTSLRLEGAENADLVLSTIVRGICHGAHALNLDPPLSKLREVEITESDNDRQPGFGLFESFASLPSITTISSRQTTFIDYDSDDDNYEERIPRYVQERQLPELTEEDPNPDYCSLPLRECRNVEELRLPESFIPTHILTDFLQRCTKLRVFEYTPRWYPGSGGVYQYRMTLLTCLKETANQTLEDLHLRFGAMNIELKKIGNFRAFRSLKRIDTDLELLYNRLIDHPTSIPLRPKLSEFLPPSIERVILHFHYALSWSQLASLTECLLCDDPRGLPRLREFILRNDRGESTPIWKETEVKGLTNKCERLLTEACQMATPVKVLLEQCPPGDCDRTEIRT